MSAEAKEDPTPEEMDAVTAALTIESGKSMALADTLFLLTLTEDLVPATERATLSAQLLADIEARGASCCTRWCAGALCASLPRRTRRALSVRSKYCVRCSTSSAVSGVMAPRRGGATARLPSRF
jgi:hypothetical protein